MESLDKYSKVYDYAVNVISNHGLAAWSREMEKHYGEKDRGIIRTILIASKPFSSCKEIRDQYAHLSNVLRVGSSIEKI